MAMQVEHLKGLTRGLASGYKRVGVRSLHGPPKVNEYVQTAVYPEIKPYKNKEEKNRDLTKRAIKDLKTVEEKFYQVNRPKLYGWYSYLISTNHIPCDILDWAKFSTLTKSVDGLPEQLQYKQKEDKIVDDVIAKVGVDIEKALLNEEFIEYKNEVSNDKIPYSELKGIKKDLVEDWRRREWRSEYLIRRIHHLIQSNLALSHQHVLASAEDHKARVEGFWFRGGIKPDKSMIKKKTGQMEFCKEREKDIWKRPMPTYDEDWVQAPYERSLQIKQSTVLQTRHDLPLAPFLPRDDPLCTEVDVPVVDYDPRCYGLKTECQKGTNIPGYWPQDNSKMGLLAYHTRKNSFEWKRVGGQYLNEEQALRDQDIAKGIFTNFSWTLSQACLLGFSPMTELTFPLVSQSVNTDGRLWSFFAYQLNRCDLTDNSHDNHTHQNIIWCHPTEKLYEKIEDGKVVGFSPDCLRPLIKMYLNEPKARDYSLTPYLDPVTPLVSDHPDAYQRKLVMENVRDQLSRRPHSFAKPELYMWEKIKLIDHNAMPQLSLARRCRWWHMSKIDHKGKEHWHPEFVSSDPKIDRYIPKGLRPEWTRKRGMGRKYNKYAPKFEVPMKEKLAVWKLPDTKYRGEHDD